MQFFCEIQVTRYKIQDMKKRYGTIRFISCILYLRILYLFDKPKFENQNIHEKARRIVMTRRVFVMRLLW